MKVRNAAVRVTIGDTSGGEVEAEHLGSVLVPGSGPDGLVGWLAGEITTQGFGHVYGRGCTEVRRFFE